MTIYDKVTSLLKTNKIKYRTENHRVIAGARVIVIKTKNRNIHLRNHTKNVITVYVYTKSYDRVSKHTITKIKNLVPKIQKIINN